MEVFHDTKTGLRDDGLDAGKVDVAADCRPRIGTMKAPRVMGLGDVNVHRGGPRIGPLLLFLTPTYCAVAAPTGRAVARGSTFATATSTASRKGETER